MTLEDIVKEYRKCALKDGEMPGEAECCRSCPLNREIYEYSEHPTFCEELTQIENRF